MNPAHPRKQNSLKVKESVRGEKNRTPKLLQNVPEFTQLFCCKEKAVIWFMCLYVSASLPLTSGPHFWCDSYGSALQGPGSLANSPPVLVYLKKLVSQKLLVAHGSYWRKAQDSWAAADFPALLVRMWGNSHLARSSGDCSSGKKKESNSAKSIECHILHFQWIYLHNCKVSVWLFLMVFMDTIFIPVSVQSPE